MLPRDLHRAKISSCLLLWARAGSSWSVTIPRREEKGARGPAGMLLRPECMGDRGFKPWVGGVLGHFQVVVGDA